MERLTVMYEGLEVPKKACTFDRGRYPDDCKGCEDICEDAGEECSECILQECMTRLGEYEKIELTPPEIMELKERDDAKAPVQFRDEDEPMLRCPYCDENVTDLMECGFRFCPYCGGRWQ